MDFAEFIYNPWTIAIGSGLILLVVSAIATIVVTRLVKKQKTIEDELNIQTQKADAKDVISVPVRGIAKKHDEIGSTGYELVQKINKEPPYLREAAEDAYLDQVIDWEVRYRGLTKVDGNNDEVRMYLVCDEGFPWVYGEVSLKDYPWLKTLNEKALLRVTGKIKKFRGHSIDLIDMTLEKK